MQPGFESRRGALLAWQARDTRYGFRLGMLGEPEGMLGSGADGTFGKVSAHSAVAGLEWNGEWRGWRGVF